jgi:hypothetical protein
MCWLVERLTALLSLHTDKGFTPNKLRDQYIVFASSAASGFDVFCLSVSEDEHSLTDKLWRQYQFVAQALIVCMALVREGIPVLRQKLY